MNNLEKIGRGVILAGAVFALGCTAEAFSHLYSQYTLEKVEEPSTSIKMGWDENQWWEYKARGSTYWRKYSKHGDDFLLAIGTTYVLGLSGLVIGSELIHRGRRRREEGEKRKGDEAKRRKKEEENSPEKIHEKWCIRHGVWVDYESED